MKNQYDIEKMTRGFTPLEPQEPQPRRVYATAIGLESLSSLCQYWLDSLDNYRGRLINGMNYSSSVDDPSYHLSFETRKMFYEEIVGREFNGYLDIDLKEIPAFLERYRDHENANCLGIFLSFIYNAMKERVIVHDPEMPYFSAIGTMLSKEKVLVNTAPVAQSFGSSSQGTIINYGHGRVYQDNNTPEIARLKEFCKYFGIESSGTIINYSGGLEGLGSHSSGLVVDLGGGSEWMGEDSTGVVINFADFFDDQISRNKRILWGSGTSALGRFSKGILINAGEGGTSFAHVTNDAIVLCVKDPFSYGDIKFRGKPRPKLLLTEKDCKKIPQLKKYLKTLRDKFEAGRNGDYTSVVEFLDSLGPDPKQTIEDDILNILKKKGYMV